MPTKEETRLFKALVARGVAVQSNLLKEQSPEPFDASASTGPVEPSLVHPGNFVPYANTFAGRGNDPSRSAGRNIPPRIQGLQDPMPGQITGSNEPGSSIRQALPALQQYPTQIVNIPTNLFSSSKDAVLAPTPLKDNPSYPTLNPVNGRHGGTGGVSDGTTPGRGNSDNPSLAPRTAGGLPANDPDVLAKALAQQLKTPVVMPGSTHQEKSYVDASRSSPFRSPLIQGVPASHQHGSTILQSQIPTPSSQVTRYPGDFNKPNPLPMNKPDASNSAGVLKSDEFPTNFLSAGVRPPKVVSQIVRESEDA